MSCIIIEIKEKLKNNKLTNFNKNIKKKIIKMLKII